MWVVLIVYGCLVFAGLAGGILAVFAHFAVDLCGLIAGVRFADRRRTAAGIAVGAFVLGVSVIFCLFLSVVGGID
jgi:hypothetical protein